MRAATACGLVPFFCGCTLNYAHTDVSPPSKMFQISRRNVDVCIDHLECACTNQHTRQRPPFELHLQVLLGEVSMPLREMCVKRRLSLRVQTRFEISGRPCRSCLDLLVYIWQRTSFNTGLLRVKCPCRGGSTTVFYCFILGNLVL